MCKQSHSLTFTHIKLLGIQVISLQYSVIQFCYQNSLAENGNK